MENGPSREMSRVTDTRRRGTIEKGYLLVLWSDGINQDGYIRLALFLIFGWPPQEIEHHMTRMSGAGRSTLACDSAEHVEHYLHELRRFGLPATIERRQ